MKSRPPESTTRQRIALENFIKYLKENNESLILRTSSDPSVSELQKQFLNLNLNLNLKWKRRIYDVKNQPSQVDSQKPEMRKLPSSSATVRSENQQCKLCEKRILAVRNFFKLGLNQERKGKKHKKIMIANYNGPYRQLRRTDQSQRFFFNTLQEDILMKEILNCDASTNLNSYSFLELPGCHFDGRKSLHEDWLLRAGNCQLHLTNKVKAHGIEAIILIGLTALWLLGQERASKFAEQKEAQLVQFADYQLPCIVLHSPSWWFNLKSGNSSEFERQLQIAKSRVSRFVS